MEFLQELDSKSRKKDKSNAKFLLVKALKSDNKKTMKSKVDFVFGWHKTFLKVYPQLLNIKSCL